MHQALSSSCNLHLLADVAHPNVNIVYVIAKWFVIMSRFCLHDDVRKKEMSDYYMSRWTNNEESDTEIWAKEF